MDKNSSQQPEWHDTTTLNSVLETLSVAPPLLLGAECDRLRGQLGEVARGEAFLVQGGDYVEAFAGATADSIRSRLRTLLQMAVVLTYGAALPVVKVGLMADRFAEPRCGPAARNPDPRRLLTLYEKSAATLNLVRAFAEGGEADLRQAHAWNQGFVRESSSGFRYEVLAGEIDRALSFMSACGVDFREVRRTEIFASHEGLPLDYEAALTRTDPSTGRVHATSGHLLWIGERTRRLDGPHLEFFSQIANPVAVRLGPSTTPDDVLGQVESLDPDREAGRLTFVVGMGASRVRDLLPALVEKALAEGVQVGWVCDPVRGNTSPAPDGRRTRGLDVILDEVRGFFEVHHSLGTHPGGIHVELTGDDVTERVDGDDVVVERRHQRYETAHDPRLNRSHSLELAFLVAEMLRGGASEPPRPGGA
ncbi:3-deoxy-7-phosphoheptulonate synthase [Streptomyces adelaidensis]|uniref:3-deoxy-7-phosphoheptulonate synthase n=1 Tax=Streptomyces adelaidensis TaxID=2796465 RepID=UPI001908A9F0|nr:3-deoxy-7-phosphoheptulonate synthase class II [Streptomyces adelaidensis]